MNFLRGVSQALHNADTNSFLSAATSQLSEMMANATKKSDNEPKFEKVSESRLKKMLKLDNNATFSCHSESLSGSAVFYAMYLPESKIAWSSPSEKAVRDFCSKLNPLFSHSKQGKPIPTTKVTNLVSISLKEPDWGTLPLSVACGFTDYLTMMIQKDTELVLNCATPDGRFPLNIAAEMGQFDSLRLLLNAGASLTQQDAFGKSVVHWAAASNAGILQELSSSPSFQPCLLLLDGDGTSPMSAAIKAANFESVQLLMGLSSPLGPFSSGPLLNVLSGMSYSEPLEKILELITTVSPSVVEQTDAHGRTILHKPLDHQVLSCLLRKSYPHIDINKADKQGNTALMMAAERGDLNAAVSLLSHGADVSPIQQGGESALFKAVKAGNVLLVKCLLLFGGSVSDNVLKQAANCRQRVEMERILKIASEKIVLDSAPIDPLDEFAQKLAFEYHASKKGEKQNIINVLSLDGGGIRGLVLIQMLLELERSLGTSIMEHFKWIGGTSTGGILALALANGKDLSHCRQLYFRLKDQIFQGSRPYNATALEDFLKEEYGPGTSMAQIGSGKTRVLVTTCQATINPPKLRLFRSYRLPLSDSENERLEYSDPTKCHAWFAARCSSAAPSYFPAVEGRWMDGGLVSNNPCCELLSDIHRYNTACLMSGQPENVRVGCVLSLGTGRQPENTVESVDLSTKVTDIVKTFNSIMHLKDMLIEQIAYADGVAVTRARNWTNSLPAAFFRFSPQLSTAIQLDEVRNDVLIEMLWDTKVYMASNSQTIAQLVDFVVKV